MADGFANDERGWLTVIRMAELAWSFLEPKDGVFDFGWLDEAIEAAGKMGFKVVLGTPIEATPTWLNFKHPAVIATDETGHIRGGRGRHCYNDKTFIAHVERIVAEMAKHYASNPAVIGWQIDNELRGTKCYCPTCMALFREWLQKQYGSLENLNEEWGTRFWSQVYNSWDEVKLPTTDQLTVSVSQTLDHFRFASDSAVEHSNRQFDIIKKYVPHHFVTHNMMGLYQWLDVFKISKKLDFIGWDSYPSVDADNFRTCMAHDLIRGAKQTNYWMMEQKNGYFNAGEYNLAIEPGLVRLWGYQDIARGADGVLFYRWRSGRYNVEQNPNGILRHDGTPRRAYGEIKQLTKEIESISKELAGTTVEAPVGILFSFDQNWALKSNMQYKNFDYLKVVMSYYRAVTGLGLTADLVEPTADLSRYRLVIAPCLMMVDSPISENLKHYVSQGGCLVIGARSGHKTWSNFTIDTPWPGLLSELTGIEIDEFEVLGDQYANTVVYKEKEYAVKVWLDMLDCKTAKPLARYSGKFYAGRTAISKNSFDKGSVVYFGVMENDDLVRDVMTDILKECHITSTPLPDGIFITKRSDSHNTFTFIINIGKEPQKITLDYSGFEITSQRSVSKEIIVNGLDVAVIKAPKPF